MERTGGTPSGAARWRAARPSTWPARLVIVCLLAVLTACSSSVSGAPTGADRPAPTAERSDPTGESIEESTEESTEEPTEESTEESEGESEGTALPAPPTSIDQSANQQYCQPFIIGPGNQRMQVVVVETPDGRVNCEQAAAVLVDYYARRPTPDPASEPIVVAGYACDQVPVPDVPQVICTDGASLMYSMWVQGG